MGSVTRELAQQAAAEQAERDAAEKAAREQAEREAAEKAAADKEATLRQMRNDVLQFCEEKALATHTHHPGLVTFPAGKRVASDLFPDGVYRRASSDWQIHIAGGCVARAVRVDNVHFWNAVDETVVEAPEEKAADA